MPTKFHPNQYKIDRIKEGGVVPTPPGGGRGRERTSEGEG